MAYSSKRTSHPAAAGFTLVEIAIVLVIIGLIIAGASRQFGTLADHDRYGTTERFLLQARKALLDYVTVNGHLPCPDLAADGLEERSGGKCAAARGFLPYVDLGLPERSDWDAPLHYAVHPAAAKESCLPDKASTGCFFQPASFDLKATTVDSGDALQVHTEAGGSGDRVARDALAVVVSFGRNSFATYKACTSGGRSAEERENCDDNELFVLTDFRDAETDAPFDDQLVWLDELMLKALQLSTLDASVSGTDGGTPGDGSVPADEINQPADGGDTGGKSPVANQPADAADTILKLTGRKCDATTGPDRLVCSGVLDARAGDDAIYGLAANDNFSGASGNDLLVGGSGNDKLDGGANDDILYGGVGRDELEGDTGDDVLYGGDDNDTLEGNNGSDWLLGGRGDDTLNGGTQNDYLYGSEGNDTLNGGKQNDRLYGGEGDDTLDGGFQHDYLHGGPGADTLLGNKGNDAFLYKLTDAGFTVAMDRIKGGNGTDTIYIEPGLGKVEISQSGTRWPVESSHTMSGINVAARLLIDGKPWAEFEGVETIVIGNP